MRDSFFIDSNIALYALDNNAAEKKKTALNIISEVPVISPQVIFECLNVCIKKLKYSKEGSSEFISFLISASFMQSETEDVVITALDLYKRYHLQVFNSKIIASALAADCSVLYSEDMQNGLVIDNRLTIVNPFY